MGHMSDPDKACKEMLGTKCKPWRWQEQRGNDAKTWRPGNRQWGAWLQADEANEAKFKEFFKMPDE